MNSQDFYLRHTDKHGKHWVAAYRVWDADLFVESQRKQAQSEGGAIVVLTEAQYQAERRTS